MKKTFHVFWVMGIFVWWWVVSSCHSSVDKDTLSSHSSEKHISLKDSAKLQDSIEMVINGREKYGIDTNYKGIMVIKEQMALCILDSASPKEASAVMERNYQKILKDVEYLNVSVAEQPGCIFYHTSPEKIVFETFLLLKEKPTRAPKYSNPVILESTLGLLYDHYGTFNHIHKSYANIRKIMEEEGYQQTGPSREIYILKEDTNQWRTRIIVPVSKKGVQTAR